MLDKSMRLLPAPEALGQLYKNSIQFGPQAPTQ